MVWHAISITTLIVAVAAFALAVGAVRRLGERDPNNVSRVVRRLLRIADTPLQASLGFSEVRSDRERIAFIVNSTKPGMIVLREAAYRACSLRYLPEPMWLTTSPDDPGTRSAREAIKNGAGALVAIGGDGTVRAVAVAAAEAGVPMGIIPSGTGNLLARNLALPLNDSYAALRVALDGSNIPVDMGWLTVTKENGDSDELPFLVIAGLGFDAEMVAGARDSLKKNLGWGAYFVAALRYLGATRMHATVRIDGGEPVTGRMRTILIANCGRLPGGVVLIPDAVFDDGILDVATLDARGGIAGWAELFGEVWFQGTRLNAPTLPNAWRIGRIDHARGTTVEITAESPQRIQVDGDSLGRALSMKARIQPGVLRVRAGEGAVRQQGRPPKLGRVPRRRKDD
jgi:diacylglycerol kinase (ATP)